MSRRSLLVFVLMYFGALAFNHYFIDTFAFNWNSFHLDAHSVREWIWFDCSSYYDKENHLIIRNDLLSHVDIYGRPYSARVKFGGKPYMGGTLVKPLMEIAVPAWLFLAVSFIPIV